jgi:uncharacterized membrane protein
VSKRTTTRAYIIAWVIYVLSGIALVVAVRNNITRPQMATRGPIGFSYASDQHN